MDRKYHNFIPKMIVYTHIMPTIPVVDLNVTTSQTVCTYIVLCEKSINMKLLCISTYIEMKTISFPQTQSKVYIKQTLQGFCKQNKTTFNVVKFGWPFCQQPKVVSLGLCEQCGQNALSSLAVLLTASLLCLANCKHHQIA